MADHKTQIESPQSTIAAISRDIRKLRRRIEELKGLDPSKAQYNDASVKRVARDIGTTLEDVFGKESLKFKSNRLLLFPFTLSYMDETQCQETFPGRITHTVKRLEELIEDLEVKRNDLEAEESDETSSAKSSEGNLEWVTVDEERDGSGRPQVPKEFIDRLAHVRYDSRKHTDMDFIIRTGAGPQAEIITQYKIYPVSTFDMKGQRLVAKATVEFPAGREYEEDWFNAFQGASVDIHDPGISGAVSTTYKMKVREVQFHKKISPSITPYALEGCLTMSEPIGSFLWRHKGAFLKWVGITVGATLIGVFIKRLL